MRICLAAVLGFVAVGCSANSSDPADSVNDVNVQSAVSALSARGSEFGLGANDQYASRSVIVDADGTRHVRFDRTFRGMRVVGGDFVVHQDAAGSIREISRTIGALSVGAQARLSTTDAIARASAALGGTYSGSATAEQVVFAGKGTPTLAYEVIVDGMKADGTPSELHAFVDARAGALLESWEGSRPRPRTARARASSRHRRRSRRILVNGVYNLRDPIARQPVHDRRWTTRTSGGAMLHRHGQRLGQRRAHGHRRRSASTRSTAPRSDVGLLPRPSTAGTASRTTARARTTASTTAATTTTRSGRTRASA